MPKSRQFIAAFSNRRLFAVVCGLLALQLLLVWYSYTERARSILWLDGRVKPDAVGVSEARWVVFHMTDPPAASGQPWRRNDFPGALYVTIPGVYFAVLVHMAWTIIPTGVVVVLGGKKRFGDWWAKRRSACRRRQGLCGFCGYDLRESPQECPECGGRTTSRL